MKLDDSRLSWQEIDGEMVVLDLVASSYLTVNEAGTVLVKRLADGCDEDGLAAALVDAFGIDARQARADADAFVAELRRRHLLTDDVTAAAR